MPKLKLLVFSPWTMKNRSYKLSKHYWQKKDIKSKAAEDGVAAINILQQKNFDLVLLDIKLPRVDGIEVLKFIRDNSFDTQVIMLTGVHDIKIAVECMQLGAYNYVTKPYPAMNYSPPSNVRLNANG